MQTYTIRPRRVIQLRNMLAMAGDAESVRFDYAPWAEDNGAVTAVTWSIESGSAGISGQALTSNVASALITNTDPGESLIKLVATAGSNKYVAHLHVYAKDPEVPASDYRLCS